MGKRPTSSEALAKQVAMESRLWGVVLGGRLLRDRQSARLPGSSRASPRRCPWVQGLTSVPAFSSPSSLSLLPSWVRGKAGSSPASWGVQRVSLPRPSPPSPSSSRSCVRRPFSLPWPPFLRRGTPVVFRAGGVVVAVLGCLHAWQGFTALLVRSTQGCTLSPPGGGVGLARHLRLGVSSGSAHHTRLRFRPSALVRV